MKKICLLIAMIIAVSLLPVLPSIGQETIIVRTSSSGLKTSSAVIVSEGNAKRLCGVLVLTDGSNNATITLYDSSTGATGKILFKATIPAASRFGGAMFNIPVRASQGIYAQISGTGASYIVYY